MMDPPLPSSFHGRLTAQTPEAHGSAPDRQAAPMEEPRGGPTHALAMSWQRQVEQHTAAVRAGALDYLPKPADPDQINAALMQSGDEMPPPPQDPMSADRVRWEHIQRVYEQCGRNVSETARRLRMHRRTLQRILGKHAPRD